MECFWRWSAGEGESAHCVLPDGCTDLIFRDSGDGIRAFAVGAMTRPLPASEEREILGVRFHPGMSRGVLRTPLAELTDGVVELECLWGGDARALERKLEDARSREERIGVVAAALAPEHDARAVERAALWATASRGGAGAGELARHAGLSARQFRRLTLAETGLGPKTLCRIARFRRAVNDIAAGRTANWAEFAVAHGFYDQAHFINEFREFSGTTPGEYAARRGAA